MGKLEWTEDELRRIAVADDLHVSPLREDGITPGTPTWIWSVMVDGGLYVRAYHGTASRWYAAAVRQRVGRIRVAGADYAVTFAPSPDVLAEAVDAAYRAKYGSSRYLGDMIGARAKAATVSISLADPRA